ncbi:alpha/beta-hydrolase [Aureobasidium subglaciale]|nr:alpha/beta-hydrolase [Aureobasidium subglaciale]
MRSSNVLLATSAALAQQSVAALHEHPVNIPGLGKVQGIAALNSSMSGNVKNWEKISFFGSIPFGADTSGDNRWRAPQPAPAWNNTLDASDFGPICPQDNPQLEAYGMSEDCLTVNIWTPATKSDEKLPVAIWSYGADNGAGVADKGIIFVSYNYRAGIFGFLADDNLGEVAGRNASGNWGILDQFAAVEWVHRNIASFGGDPDHISVIGQSFGSGATYHIVNSPLTADFGIVNAISESGVTWPSDPYTTEQANAYINQTEALSVGVEALAAMNATSVASARAMSYSDVLSATSDLTMSFLPVLDYYAIPQKYSYTLKNGAGNKVPYITGFNADESGASSTLATTVSAYENFVNGFYGDSADTILSLWSASNDSEAAVSESDLVRESFRTSAWLTMNAFADSSDVDTFTYYWTHGAPGGDGASHGSEIVYVLGNLWAQTGTNYTSEDYYISNIMSAYWANFMKTGNPNRGGSYRNGTLPAKWDAASTSGKKVFEVGEAWKMVPVASDAKIAALKEYYAGEYAY